MELEGGCHCGAVRYRVSGEQQHVAICHCRDCRKSAGAPMVSWAAFPSGCLAITRGEPRSWNSSGDAYRSFCADCGTGLWYVNETFLPGLVDIQTATLDDPEALPPRAHVQVAERLDWMTRINDLPELERSPGQ